MNQWFVIGKFDDKCSFGYRQLTPKGTWFNTYKEADLQRCKMQKESNDLLVIMRRTCEVMYE